MKKLSTLKAALEKDGLQVRLETLNNVNGTGVSCPVLIVSTEYEGLYPDKECVNKHALARKIGKVLGIDGIAKCHLAGHNNNPKIAFPVLTPDRSEKRQNGIFVKLSDELTVYAVWYEKYQCYIAIRKLTPKECFRLQGWPDDYFEKAQFVNSDSQLYKQAGNGVTVTVIEAIARKMNVNLN